MFRFLGHATLNLRQNILHPFIIEPMSRLSTTSHSPNLLLRCSSVPRLPAVSVPAAGSGASVPESKPTPVLVVLLTAHLPPIFIDFLSSFTFVSSSYHGLFLLSFSLFLRPTSMLVASRSKPLLIFTSRSS